jgi:hypothetical protein
MVDAHPTGTYRYHQDIWESFSGGAWLIVVLWLLCLILGLLVRRRWNMAVMGKAANLIIVLSVAFPQQRPVGFWKASGLRPVSLGAGLWLTLAGPTWWSMHPAVL